MLAALILILAQVGGPPSDAEIQGWIEDLSSPSPLERQNAARRLLEGGARAANALEQTEFAHPESRLRAQDLLEVLRTPTIALRAPPFVPNKQADITIEVLIHNPRPTELSVRPLFGRARRNTAQRTKQWSFELTSGIAGPFPIKGLVGKQWTVAPRSDVAIPVRFRVRPDQGKSFRIGVSYRSVEFESSGHTLVRVGKESLPSLRMRAYSPQRELRDDTVLFIRHRLQTKATSPTLYLALKTVARSPYRDVRFGLAKALYDYGRHADPTQTDLLTMLATDRDLGVARVAFGGLAKVCSMTRPPRATVLLAARLLARQPDARRTLLDDMLGRVPALDRRRFLATILKQSRSRIVHANAASILRRDGYPVEPSANGLVPRSQIAKLAR